MLAIKFMIVVFSTLSLTFVLISRDKIFDYQRNQLIELPQNISCLFATTFSIFAIALNNELFLYVTLVLTIIFSIFNLLCLSAYKFYRHKKRIEFKQRKLAFHLNFKKTGRLD